MILHRSSTGLLVCAFVLVGCGEPAPGTIEARIYGEAFIEEGIPADVFSDGWSVTFHSFLVEVSDLQISAGHTGEPVLTEGPVKAFDLVQPSAGAGQVVATAMVPGGSYDHLAYRLRPVQVSGRAEKAGSPPVTFAWAFDSSVLHDCHTAISVDGATATTELTIHGDHLFYDDLFSESPLVAFDLIATSDADGDRTVTAAELVARDIATQARYQVGSTGISNLWDFIAYQATTLGHIDGEGHCETSVD